MVLDFCFTLSKITSLLEWFDTHLANQMDFSFKFSVKDFWNVMIFILLAPLLR